MYLGRSITRRGLIAEAQKINAASEEEEELLKFLSANAYTPRTGGSVGWASGCYAGGRESDSDRTNTQGLKITEEKVLPL